MTRDEAIEIIAEIVLARIITMLDRRDHDSADLIDQAWHLVVAEPSEEATRISGEASSEVSPGEGQLS